MDLSKTRILLLSHISDLSGPTEALEDFLVKKRTGRLYLIYNPLEYCRLKKRVVRLYESDILLKEIYPINIKHGKILTWFFEFFITLYYSLRSWAVYDIAICCDGLNFVLGLVLSRLGRVNKLIYYTIDWTPQRFKNKFLNFLYQKINNYSLKHADEIWSVTVRLLNLQVEKGALTSKIKHVPVGVKNGKDITQYKFFDYKALVFLGALEKTKGIESIIKAWPHLIKKDLRFRLIVIGKTPGNSRYYEDILGSMPNVEILGVLPHQEVLKILPKYGIGLAPYTRDDSTVSFYGDPSRIKDYLVCGLPVVVTRTPEISSYIEKSQAGKVIDFSIQGLIDGIESLIQDRNTIGFYRNNAINLAKRYRWDNIFSNALELDKDSNDENSACIS